MALAVRKNRRRISGTTSTTTDGRREGGREEKEGRMNSLTLEAGHLATRVVSTDGGDGDGIGKEGRKERSFGEKKVIIIIMPFLSPPP